MIGIWIRVSTEDQARGDSPEHHEQRARLYAEAQGYTVREVYKLDAVSGKSVMEHAETKRMLADIRARRIHGLIFSKLARLARNTRELLDFADIFRENDAALISLQESLDTGTPAGRFFYTVIGALAEWERGEIADRVAASVAIRAKLGKPLGGRAPYGYQWKDRKLIPHPDEAPVRKLIYDLYKKHRRKKTVAQILNERGYRSRAGKKYAPKVIEDLIRDTAPKGLYRANYSTRRNGGRHEIKAEEEWVHTQIEPIVPEALWDECNRILMTQKSGKGMPGPRPEHLFGGKVRCTCGRKMYARKQTGKYMCDGCGMKIPAADLETIYHSELKGFLFSDAELADYLGNAENQILEKEALIATRTEERGKIQKDIDRLYDLYLAGEIPKDGFGLKYRPLEERQRQIDTEVMDLQVQVDVGRITKVNQDHLIGETRALHSRWPSFSHDKKRDIIQTITTEIVVGKEEINIRLEHLPMPGKPVDGGTYQVGSPLGWLCTRITALAPSSSARLTISRG